MELVRPEPNYAYVLLEVWCKGLRAEFNRQTRCPSATKGDEEVLGLLQRKRSHLSKHPILFRGGAAGPREERLVENTLGV